MWARDQGAMQEAGLDVSIFLAGGQGDFVLGLKDGKLGIDRAIAGQRKPELLFLGLVLRAFCFFGGMGSLVTMSLMDVCTSALSHLWMIILCAMALLGFCKKTDEKERFDSLSDGPILHRKILRVFLTS